MVRIGRTGLKFPRFIPPPRRIILGMYKQAANSSDIGSLRCAQQCILEQGLTQFFALMLLVNRKTSQNHDWHWVTRKALHES